MAYEQKIDPDKDLATRTGEFAMLIYSIGAIYSELLSVRLNSDYCNQQSL